MTSKLDDLLDEVSRSFSEIELRYGTGVASRMENAPKLTLLSFDEPDATDQKIAEINDLFRTTDDSTVRGFKFCSPSLVEKGEEIVVEINALVRAYDDFTLENDPLGKRDRGVVVHPTLGDVVWQIDYYESEACEEFAAHPEDPERSYRVLATFLDGDVPEPS